MNEMGKNIICQNKINESCFISKIAIFYYSLLIEERKLLVETGITVRKWCRGNCFLSTIRLFRILLAGRAAS